MSKKIRRDLVNLSKNFKPIQICEFSIRMCKCKNMKSLKKRSWEMFISHQVNSQLCSILCRTVMLMLSLPQHLPLQLVWAAVTQIETWRMGQSILPWVNEISKRRLSCFSVFLKTVLTVARLRKSFESFLTLNQPGTICKCLFAKKMRTVLMKMKVKMMLQV